MMNPREPKRDEPSPSSARAEAVRLTMPTAAQSMLVVRIILASSASAQHVSFHWQEAPSAASCSGSAYPAAPDLRVGASIADSAAEVRSKVIAAGAQDKNRCVYDGGCCFDCVHEYARLARVRLRLRHVRARRVPGRWPPSCKRGTP